MSHGEMKNGSNGAARQIRTLLIGLDGATFDVLDPLMQSGVMPFLQSFFAHGVRADLRTIVPALTPPAWTSLATGRTPGQHGVFDFFRMESAESRHIRFFTSHDVQCETIWSLASGNDLRVTSLNFPAMFPAPRISGNVVPGWVPWKQLRLACWPENLFERLKNMPGFNPRELAMDIKLEEKATEGCSDYAEYGPWIQLHIRREQNWLEIFKFLTAEDPSELTAVLFDGVDKLQHLCWRFIRPEDATPLTEDWELEIRRLCLEYFRSLDRIIESMCEIAGPETTVLLASDHGFGPTYQVFHVNAWLEQHGYLAWSDAAKSQEPNGALLGVGQVARHTWMLDWDRTKAYAATPTANGIFIPVNRDGNSPGVSPEEYLPFRQKLIDELRAFRDPETGKPYVTGIWTRDECFEGPHKGVAPDITLAFDDGGLVGILPSATMISRRPITGGAHRPVGIFGAKGPAIPAGVRAAEMSILDVAPVVLHSLHLPVLEDMQGRVPTDLFEAAALQSRPVVKTRAAHAMAHPPEQETTSQVMSREDEQAVVERLRELGYIE
jgi:predicted AlkP superfamily phosphohydrolase/phosphomutase